MHQAFAVSSVYFVAVLIVEESGDVLESFRNGAMDSRSAFVASIPRSNCESRVTGGDLRNTLPRKDVAHVN